MVFQTRFLGSCLHRIKQGKENDPQNDLIREFSIQLLQDQIFISANGVFHVDYNLIGSVSAFPRNAFHYIIAKKIHLNYF